MPDFEASRREWLSNPRGDILAGIVVALALIPEAIGFSIIAGVDPRVGLYASFSIAVIVSLAGGRPGMISAATAAIAVLVVPLVRDHGIDYLFAATILMGVVQVIDVSQAHFWDISAVGTLDKAILKFRREGVEVSVTGLNEASASMVDRYALHDKPGAEAQLGAH